MTDYQASLEAMGATGIAIDAKGFIATRNGRTLRVGGRFIHPSLLDWFKEATE